MLRTIAFVVAVMASATLAAQEPTYRYWETDWSFDEISVDRLTDRLESIGIELPVQLRGTASVRFEVSVPINALRTWQAYRFQGNVSVMKFQADQLKLDQFAASVDYRDGKLTLNDLLCIQPGGGKVRGDGSMELVPQKDFDAQLKLEKVQLAPILKLASELQSPMFEKLASGVLSGNMAIEGQVNQLDSPLDWTGKGKVEVQDWQAPNGQSFVVAIDSVELRERQFDLSRLTLRSQRSPQLQLLARGRLDLSERPTIDAEVFADDLPLTSVASVIAMGRSDSISGKLDLKGKVSGSLAGDPGAPLTADLSIASPSLIIAGVDLGTIEHEVRWREGEVTVAPRIKSAETVTPTIGELSLRYTDSADALTVDLVRGKLFGGEWVGGARLSKDGTADHQLKFTIDQVKPRIRLPVSVGARRPWCTLAASGKVDWTVPAGKIDAPATHHGQVDLQLSQVELDGQALGDIALLFTVRNQQLKASGSGQILGGDFEWKTVASPSAETSWEALPRAFEVASLKLNGIEIAALAKLTGVAPGFVSGTLASEIELRSREQTWEAQVAWEMESLRLQNELVSRRLVGELLMGQTEIVLKSLSGSYAGGRMQASGRWAIEDGGERQVELSLRGCDGSRVLLPISPEVAKSLGGRVNANCVMRAKGPLESLSVRASGFVDVEKTTMFDMPLGNAHGPFEVLFHPSTLRWRLDLPAVQSKLAGGRLSGGMHLRSASRPSRFHLDSQWRVVHVDFEQLLSTYAGTSTIGQGDVTGELKLRGRDIRGSKDLSGRFRFILGGTDATAVPGLSAAGALLGAGSLPGTRFSGGHATGQIARNKILFEEISLASDRIGLKAEGKLSIDSQRIDVRAQLATGNFQGQDILLNLAGVAAPLGQFNRIISDRTVIFDVVGPTRDPIVRLLPAETFRANAERFVIQEALGAAAANSLLFD